MHEARPEVPRQLMPFVPRMRVGQRREHEGGCSEDGETGGEFHGDERFSKICATARRWQPPIRGRSGSVVPPGPDHRRCERV